MKKLSLKKHLSYADVVGRIVSEKSLDFVSKSFPQGEWCLLTNAKKETFLAFSLRRTKAQNEETAFFGVSIVDEKFHDDTSVDEVILQILDKAYYLRKNLNFNVDSARLFYGDVEGLLGLQVDSYQNALLLQISTYAVALKGPLIKQFYQKLFPQKKILLRHKTDFIEVYPIPEEEGKTNEPDLQQISYEENGLKYDVPMEIIQKNGHYFDQVKNRTKIGQLLDQLKNDKLEERRSFKNGLDLFCYTGGWGHLFLKKGCEQVTFVDQGNFEQVVIAAHKNNQLQGKAEFQRSDVFNFLDKAIQDKKTFDLISCDPPPFAKSFATKDNALSGYERLSHKLCKVMAPYGLLVFSSCTKYVSMEELQKVVHEAAKKNQRKSYLLELGTQPLDHPFTTFSDHSFYLKMVTYLII